MCLLGPVHTGDKVEFDNVALLSLFCESRLSPARSTLSNDNNYEHL